MQSSRLQYISVRKYYMTTDIDSNKQKVRLLSQVEAPF